MKILQSALLLAAAAVASAVSPAKLAADVSKLEADIKAVQDSAASQAALAVQDTEQSCRSAESEGLCQTDCGEQSVIDSPDRLGCATGKLCCELKTEDVEFTAAMETDADGGYEPDGVANVDPDAGSGDFEEEEARHANFLRPQEKCYGDQEPYDCGQAYRKGRPLGHKMCVKMRGHPIVESIACKLEEMLRDAEAAGNTVTVTSGFRTNAKQAELRRKYCARGNCGRAAPAGYSNHQNGIAVDIACRTNPRLYAWLKANAHKYDYVRTVHSEEWHWEYRPGSACDRFVKRERATGRKYECVNAGEYERRNAGELKTCKNHDDLVCSWGKDSCAGNGEYHSGECSGDTWCCKEFIKPEAPPAPACDDYPDLQCLPGKSSCKFGYHSGQCRGDTWCCKPEPQLAKCDNHPDLVCKHGRSSCGSAGYHAGECRGDTWCCKE